MLIKIYFLNGLLEKNEMKKIYYILFLILAPLIKLFSQDSTSLFTQQQFVDVVLRYHPIAKQADITIEKAKADILFARGGFDPMATIGISQKTFDGARYYDHVQPELRIPTWYGIELVAGAEYLSGQRTNAEETLGKTSYAGVVVPLAKNLVMDKRRAALQIAKIYRNLSEAEKSSTINNLLLEASKTYWEWALQYERYKVFNNAVSVNQRRLQLVKTAFYQGDRSALDTVEASTQLQNFQFLQNDAFMQWQNAALDMSIFLWKENSVPYNLPGNVTPDSAWITEVSLITYIPLLDDILYDARINHPDLQQYPLKLDAQAIEQKLKFQELLPKVDFKYNQLGKGYNILNAKSGPLLDNNFQYGISFQMPLRLSYGRGEYRQAKLKIAATKLEQDLKMVQVENKIKSYYNELVTLLSQTELTRKSYQNFYVLQKGEELKFFNGESSLFMVNSRESKTLEAVQKLLKTKTDFYKTYNALQWSAGLLF